MIANNEPKLTKDTVPKGLHVASSWAWRILAIIGAIAVIGYILGTIATVVVPLLAGILITSLLTPTVTFLVKHKFPRGLAVAIAVLIFIFLLVFLVWIAISQFSAGYPALERSALEKWQELLNWAANSPAHIDIQDLWSSGKEILESAKKNAKPILHTAWGVGSSLGNFLAGAALTLFCTIFTLLDGKNIWQWTCRLFPKNARPAINTAAKAGWITLGRFMKVQVLVAAIDAVGITIGALLIGLPMAFSIGIIVFLGSFIPILGALISGALAVLIALIILGPIYALIMFGIVLLVQQLEGHVLQPFIMGSAVRVHPLAVVLAVATGSLVAGVTGALFAVPVVAFANVFISSIASKEWQPISVTEK